MTTFAAQVSDVLAALEAVRDPELDEPVTELGFVSSCTVSADGVADVLRSGTGVPSIPSETSASTVCAEQKMSRTSCWVSLGTAVNAPVAGSKMVAEIAPMQVGPPSHMRSLPVFNRTMFMATIGKSITPDHCPTCAGSVMTLETVTDRVAEVVKLPAASQARAARVCVPLEAVVESHVMP